MKKLFVILVGMFLMVGCGGSSGGSSDKKSDTPVPILPVVEADFLGNPVNGPEPLEVVFNETSTGNIESWLWDFGDGETSTDQNPVHIYNQDKYTVSLTVTGPDGSDTITKIDYITVDAPLIEAYFSATPINGAAPLEVTFNESSTGNIDNWLWDFGDGETSIERNPIHVYDFAGHQQDKYTVSLTVTGPDGSDTLVRLDYITIDDPGYGYFNPDNAVDLAVKIYMNGEESFDVMDVPIKNAPIFFRYGVALRNLIKQIIELGEIQGNIYDNFGGHVHYIVHNNDIWMTFYSYYCEDENVNIPGIIKADHISVYNYNNGDYWHANQGFGSFSVGPSYLKLYKSSLRIDIGKICSSTGDIISMKNGIYNQVEITDQHIQWNLYGFSSFGFLEVNDEPFLHGSDNEDAIFFIIYNNNAFPSQGSFVIDHEYPVSGGFPIGKDSSLKFLIISASSFQVFVDTYSDGIYDWDSGVLNWDDYNN